MTGLVLPDANVLFNRTLRDWLFLLAHRGRLYTIHSTEDLLAEPRANIATATRWRLASESKHCLVNSVTAFILVKS